MQPRAPRDMATQYTAEPLRKRDVDPDPIQQFQKWYDEAAAIDPALANAMTLSTIDAAGRPTARIMLLKGIEDGGFVFYTHHTSDKAADLAREPHAALTFWWAALYRQVRIEGTTEKLSHEAAVDYFRTRPRNSQLGALASDQSQPLSDRDTLVRRVAELDEQYADKPIPMPKTWGGYRVNPTKIEFWQGQPDRLNDRLLYMASDACGEKWNIQRLAP